MTWYEKVEVDIVEVKEKQTKTNQITLQDPCKIIN